MQGNGGIGGREMEYRWSWNAEVGSGEKVIYGGERGIGWGK